MVTTVHVTPWTVACPDPLSKEFSRQESWSRLPFPSPGDLPDPGIEPVTPALQADSLPTELPGKLQLKKKKNGSQRREKHGKAEGGVTQSSYKPSEI